MGSGDPKQPRIAQGFFFKSNCTKTQFNESLVDHIVFDMKEFTMGEGEHFQKMIKLLDPNKTCPDHKVVTSIMGDKFKLMNENLLHELSKAVYICICTDAWAGNKKNYAGYTATWLNEDLVREMAVLAIRRIKGSHSFEAVRKEITGILKEFK